MHVFLLKMSSTDDLMEAIHATHPICSLIAKSPEACQRCRESIETCVDAAVKSGNEVVTCRCPFGLWRTVIPISTESKPVILYSGRVLLGRRDGYENIRAAFLNNLRGFLSPALINSSRHAASRVQLLHPRIYAADVEMLRLLGREMKLVAPSIRRQAQQSSIFSPFVLRAKTLINERHAEPLHLDQVARELHVNRHYLSHMFHDQTGLTFTEYLTQIRIKSFERLLRESRCTVTEAAFAAGFQSLSQANRVFHAQTGQSPQAFRKSIAA